MKRWRMSRLGVWLALAVLASCGSSDRDQPSHGSGGKAGKSGAGASGSAQGGAAGRSGSTSDGGASTAGNAAAGRGAAGARSGASSGGQSGSAGSGDAGDDSGGSSGAENAGASGASGANEGGAAGEPAGPIGSESGLICNAEHFCWESPLPQGNNLRGVWAASNTDVWAVGEAGTIIHYDGSGWSNQAALAVPNVVRSDIQFNGVWGSASNDVWFIGQLVPQVSNGSVILHWNGSALSAFAHPASFGIRTISGSAEDNVYVTASGGLLKFDGSEWKAFDCSPCNPTTVWTGGADLVWEGGFSGELRYWDGVGWNDPTGLSLDLAGIWGSSKDDVWVVGYGGQLAHWNGMTVEPVTSHVFEDLLGVWGSGPNDVWAAGRKGSLVHVVGGVASVVDVGETYDLLAGYASSASNVWTVGTAGHLYRSDGVEWSPMWRGITDVVNVVRGRSSSDVYFGTTTGLYHWDESAEITRVNGGAFGPDFDVKGVLPLPGDELWAVGAYSTHYGDAGWYPSASANFECIWGANSNDVWATGNGSPSLRHWTGTEWLENDDPFGGYAMDGTAKDDIWLAGAGGIVAHYDGKTWTSVFSGTNQYLWGITAVQRGEAWAVGMEGVAIHYVDGAFEPQPAATLERLTGVHAIAPADVWAVGMNGTAQRWDGGTWQGVATGTNQWLDDVWASGKNDVWVTGAYGAVLHKRR